MIIANCVRYLFTCLFVCLLCYLFIELFGCLFVIYLFISTIVCVCVRAVYWVVVTNGEENGAKE